MSRARAAKKLAQAAAFGGGGLGLIGATLYGVLTAEAEYAKRVIGPMRLLPDSGRRPVRPVSRTSDHARHARRLECRRDTAPTRPTRPPACCSPPGSPSWPSDRSGWSTSRKTGAKSTDLAAQVDAALQAGPHVAVILIGVERREGEDAAVDVGPPARPPPYAGCAPRTVRSWWAPAPTWGSSGRSSRRCGRSPGPGATGWPPLRPSQSSRQAAAPCHGLAARARRSGPTRRCGAGTTSTRPPPGTPPRRPRCCLPWRPRWASGPSRSCTRSRSAARRSCRSRKPPYWLPGPAGTEVAATEVAGQERGPRGRWAELRHRRRHPKAEVDRVEDHHEETTDSVPVGH